MKTILIICIITILACFQAVSQNILTLQQCHEKALNNLMENKNSDLYKRITELKINHSAKNYLPQLNLNAQITYQSEVTAIDLGNLPFPVNLESPSKDQYKATLDFSQMIYDGGVTKKYNQLQQSDLLINLQNIEIAKYQLKNQVNEYYFMILIMDKQIEIMEILKKDLEQKKNSISSAIKNGILTESDLFKIQAEIYKIEQQITEIKYQRLSLINALEILTATEIEENSKFLLQEIEISFSASRENFIKRPEKELFKLQEEKINSTSQMIKAKRNPKLFAFGQLGYGKPGLNFLNDEFGEFYIIGLKLNWQIWDWEQNKMEREELQIQQQILNNKELDLDQKLNITGINAYEQINKTEELIQQDNKIVSLLEQISENSAVKLEHGTYTTTDYLNDKYKEIQARLNLEIHKIQYEKSKIDYLSILNEQ